MPATYEPIATTTLGSAASSITFSSIPATYTDLRLVMVAKRSGATSNYVVTRVNGDSGSNYSDTQLNGNGSSAASSRNTSAVEWYNGTIAVIETNPALFTLDIFSYAGSTFKTALSTFNNDRNGSGGVQYNVNLWRSTAAINSLTIYASTGNYDTGSTATLYGIKNF
jgi:hypothetical protein